MTEWKPSLLSGSLFIVVQIGHTSSSWITLIFYFKKHHAKRVLRLEYWIDGMLGLSILFTHDSTIPFPLYFSLVVGPPKRIHVLPGALAFAVASPNGRKLPLEQTIYVYG
jgi:hypothetical protein